MDKVPLTARLAEYAIGTDYAGLPDTVQREAVRAFHNWVGVALGGSTHPTVHRAGNFARRTGGTGPSTALGQGFRTDPASAAFVNCMASAVLAFDDAHMPSVAHPSGPACAAIYAVAQGRKTTGKEFLNAIALGIEMQCRVANMLVLPPSALHADIYVNGFSGPVGVGLGVGRLIGLTEQQMVWSVGIAASQASGFRGVSGSMTSQFRPGHASRAGVVAALLASEDFDCTYDPLEGRGGLIDIFAAGADQEIALAGLGQEHEMLNNRYKPYPSGIVCHPTIDACLDIAARLPEGTTISGIHLTVHPLALTMTGIRHPGTSLEARVSIFHLTSMALLHKMTGLDATAMERVTDAEVTALRDLIVADPVAGIGKGEAIVEVTLSDGSMLRSHIVKARGSRELPMSDADLERKFLELVETVLPPDKAATLSEMCWNVADSKDVSATFEEFLV
ncbi:MmgE/PrpD family protein [Antarctobacter sp.]|uniref:MmgE/PrpD family protein n=1 Tax=Antarctobacter sp. TaxID=1872577 RepID=UPI003A8E1124